MNIFNNANEVISVGQLHVNSLVNAGFKGGNSFHFIIFTFEGSKRYPFFIEKKLLLLIKKIFYINSIFIKLYYYICNEIFV